MTRYDALFQADELAALFPLDARDMELAHAAADGVYELVRRLNHYAGAPEVAMPYAANAYRITGNLAAAVHALASFAELLADRCSQWATRDDVRHASRGRSPVDVSRTAARVDLSAASLLLNDAARSAAQLGEQINAAQSALASISHDTDVDERES